MCVPCARGGARARECATSAEAAGRKREQQRQQLVPAVNWAPGAARGGQVAKEKPRKTSRSSKEEENQRNSNQARSRAHARTDLVQPSKEFGRATRRLSKVIYFFSPLLHCHQARCVCVCARVRLREKKKIKKHRTMVKVSEARSCGIPEVCSVKWWCGVCERAVCVTASCQLGAKFYPNVTKKKRQHTLGT